ncbi:hypothetical protein CWI42_020900 [Ordospora colligata]|uniref:t-SNARE coiled-coil homology domain-containing protein n=1 Tax=Ordospora colligata OC4 TaxID=1354746 RepID=A0A0B2ULZ5_9MICR|nr:uncharacterized protein M896_020910 [Ordospora colligata OC4]KHN70254.1 hypothetical protein M896_020910 [Ordospora colligata OC4]TBU16798.1 hypothetical protein CWI41_020920 [Ordospora colligata]TBU16906.1 hypothetical protein CWI40_020920 [Ordospora colligata]TBU19347.1 hypothetical protein CWI42_020900 [Ordospora colligata]
MPGDIYSLEKAEKSKKNGVPQDVIEEAERIEEENYERARNIRVQIDESALKQRATTEEMLRQGETLENAKKSALEINRNAVRGAELTEDIEREGHMFSCELPCVRAIKRWLNRNRGDVSDVARTREVREVDEESRGTVMFEEDGEEYVKGQNKTDKEMVGILNAVKQVNKEAKRQNREIERHKGIVDDISIINERSEKVIKDTDKELNKME